jgi:hypothetical protein
MPETIDTEIYVRNFSRYQSEMGRIGQLPRFADYDWYQFPENASISWLAYNLMLTEFARSISNTLNALGNYSRRLLAWHSTLQDISENERLALVFEFVDPIAVLAANLPQIVRSRFIFAIVQLSHQANKVLDKVNWKDDLPNDKGINFEHVRKYAERWHAFPGIEVTLNNLFSETHKSKTNNYRNKYHHRFPPQELAGYSGFVHREIDKTKTKQSVKYIFGALPPTDLSKLGSELLDEFARGLSALDQFKLLVTEQLEAIKNAPDDVQKAREHVRHVADMLAAIDPSPGA